MSPTAERIRREALQLSPDERAALADELYCSLEQPDPAVDAACVEEALDRLSAVDAGEMETYPAEEVLAELERL